MSSDPRRLLASLCVSLVVFLSASPGCTSPHECGPGCESAGYAPAAPAAAVQESTSEEEEQPISSAEALAAFDSAWQAINDTHFDPQFNGVDWAALREELRPRAEAAKTREEVRDVIADMLERLQQSHFVVIPSEALPDSGREDGEVEDEGGGVGFDVRFREERLLVTTVEPGSAAAEVGVEPGWIVERIGSLDVAEALARMGSAGEALDERQIAMRMWLAAHGRIVGTPGESVEMLLRDGEDREHELELERRPRDVTAHSFGTTLPTFYLEFRSEILEHDGLRIGRIRFSNWFLPMMPRIDEAMEEMRGLDGIVIDLRGNTGGAGGMTMGVAGHFFEETRELGVMKTRDSTVNFLALPRTVNAAGEIVQPFAGPVAILTDETTGSASEVFAGGMQSVGRARVFGETTAGAVLPAMTTPLPNGDALLHAMGDFETATGVHLEGQGVAPDERVPLERPDLLAGRDRPLAVALDWIASQKRS